MVSSAVPQVIKNLLFVAKVIYLISPESEIPPAREVEEGGEEEEMENGGERENDGEDDEGEKGDEEKEEEKQEEEEDEKDDRPPSLLWMMKKLSLMAKREAADTPKIPLKVHTNTPIHGPFMFSQHHCLFTDGDLMNICNKCLPFLSLHREHVCLSSWGP